MKSSTYSSVDQVLDRLTQYISCEGKIVIVLLSEFQNPSRAFGSPEITYPIAWTTYYLSPLFRYSQEHLLQPQSLQVGQPPTTTVLYEPHSLHWLDLVGVEVGVEVEDGVEEVHSAVGL